MAMQLPTKSSLRTSQTNMSNASCGSTCSTSSSGLRMRSYRWRYLELIKEGLIWLTGKRTRAVRSSDTLFDPSAANASRARNSGIQKILRLKKVRSGSRGSARNRSRSACSRRHGKTGYGKKGRKSSSRGRRHVRGKKLNRGGVKCKGISLKSPVWKIAKRCQKKNGSRRRQISNLKKSGKVNPSKRRDVKTKTRRGASRYRILGSKPITCYRPQDVTYATKRRGKDMLVFVQPINKAQKGLQYGMTVNDKVTGRLESADAKRILRSAVAKKNQTPTSPKNMTSSCPKHNLKLAGPSGRPTVKGMTMVTRAVSRRQLTRAAPRDGVLQCSSTYVATPLGTATYLSQQ